MSLQDKAKSKAAKGYLSKLGWVHEQKDDVLTWGGLYERRLTTVTGVVRLR
ncbi:hypothetical protein [Brevibacillus massiliensis]|uniref:hypothetical protein n=1 Tax=Brevibacillus massiliensis TaxID=1118054 RepID=UPI0002E3D9B8|nr:hypothetical protein [Brevibacillus massiliensis]